MSLLQTQVQPRELRPYQAEAIELLRQSLRSGHRRPILQAPTGWGKTRLASEIVMMARERGNRIVFCVPALSLIDQTLESFWKEGIGDVGVIQANHFETDWSRPVQVASVQTLQRRPLPDAQLVIVDECHKLFKHYTTWMQHPEWTKVPFIGLSATPWTKGLGKHYDDLIISATTADLIEAGFLAKFRVFAPAHPDLTGVRVQAGDYVEGDLAKAMDKAPLIADVVETWLRKGEGRPTLCFGVDRAHAKHLQERFESVGVQCGYQDMATEPDERAEIKRKFHNGEYAVVSNVGTLTTGVDWDVRCIILARPTRSEILYVQIIGRGLRTADGKDDCVARDTLILTDKGQIKIQDVTLDHKLWDGVEFVSHAGAVCRGVRPVIEHDGILATPDHRVMTDVGWEKISAVADRNGRIARTGIGGQPIRFFNDSFEENRRFGAFAASGRALRALRHLAYGIVPQHQETSRNASLPALQSAGSNHCAEVALCQMPSTAGSLCKRTIRFLSELWGAWDRISVFWSERSGAMGGRQSWDCRPVDAVGSHRQSRTLRTWEFTMGQSRGSNEQYSEESGRKAAVRKFSQGTPIDPLCRQNVTSSDSDGAYRSKDHREMACAVEKTEREVWDILNSGPLQRFTANGRLVHNCLILDHSDTTLKLGFVTDIIHESLDMGTERQKQEKKKPLPKECPSCSYLMPPGTPVCPACGFQRKVVSNIAVEDGEVVELTRNGGSKRVNSREIEIRGRKIPLGQFYGELKDYARTHGYRDGWASNKYREAAGTWPNAYRDTPMVPVSFDVESWVKARARAWAKKQPKRGGNHGSNPTP